MRRVFLRPAIATSLCGALLAAALPQAAEESPRRPNVLFVLADDMSWPHAGAYGEEMVDTPGIDRLAREGVLFEHAYSPVSSCAPSRNAILTGQQPWRLGSGGVFGGLLPPEHDSFPLLLQRAGYASAWTGKAYGPGPDPRRVCGWKQHPAGKGPRRPGRQPRTVDFVNFLSDHPAGRPFFFWYGSRAPHREYPSGSGARRGKDPGDVEVPAFLPDVPEVRHDLLDYYAAVERFDTEVVGLLDVLEQNGLVENTLVIVTSDNGMPFPRCKGDCYDASNRVPLVVRWPAGVPGGRVVTDFTDLTDIAPTLLEVAGAEVPERMSGRSLLPTLTSEASGQVDPARDFVVTSFERHGWARPNGATYPVRAIRTRDHAYIRNLEPDRWPNGDPHFTDGPFPDKGTAFLDVDASPTLEVLTARAEDPAVAPAYELCLGRRPGEELYDLTADPWQVHDLAADPEHAELASALRQRLERHLLETGDPRARGEKPFDAYPFYTDGAEPARVPVGPGALAPPGDRAPMVKGIDPGMQKKD